MTNSKKVSETTVTVATLKAEASKLGIKGYSRMSKEKLQEQINSRKSIKEAPASQSMKDGEDDKTASKRKAQVNALKESSEANQAAQPAESKELKQTKKELVAAKTQLKVAKKELNPTPVDPTPNEPKETKKYYFRVSCRRTKKGNAKPIGVVETTTVSEACKKFSSGKDGYFFSAKKITFEEFEVAQKKAEKKAGKKSPAKKSGTASKPAVAKKESAPKYTRFDSVCECIKNKKNYKSMEELIQESDDLYVKNSGKNSNLKESSYAVVRTLRVVAHFDVKVVIAK